MQRTDVAGDLQMESHLLDQMSRLNNELINSQRDLKKKNHLLEQQAIELQALNSRLQASETHFRKLFDLLPVGVTLTDKSGQILRTNPASEKLLGIPSDDLTRRRFTGPYWSIIRPDGSPMPQNEYASVRAMNEQRRVEGVDMGVIRPDGAITWITVSAEPVSEAGMGVIIVYSDISDRKQVENTLALSNRLLEIIINTIPFRIFWKDKDFRLLGCNLAFARDVGTAHPDDLIGKDDYQIVGKELAELYRDADRRIIESKVPILSYKEPLTTAKGDRIWLRTSKVPLFNEDGESIGILGVYDDITAQKQAEEELLQAKELAESATQAKSRFLSIVAHEFHTPLHLLNISTDILDHYGERLSTAEKQELHEQIRNASRQMTTLIDSVPTFNRQEKATYLPAPVLVDIPNACSIISDEVNKAWNDNHDFHVYISSECGKGLLDETLFRRLLENLLTNAFRFTPAGGRVSLNVSRQSDRLNIEVSDTGIGIPEEDQKKIFEAFYRSSNIDARRGLGLGLSIVSDALRALSGSITLSSSVGEGTTFRVELPVSF